MQGSPGADEGGAPAAVAHERPEGGEAGDEDEKGEGVEEVAAVGGELGAVEGGDGFEDAGRPLLENLDAEVEGCSVMDRVHPPAAFEGDGEEGVGGDEVDGEGAGGEGKSDEGGGDGVGEATVDPGAGEQEKRAEDDAFGAGHDKGAEGEAGGDGGGAVVLGF